MNRKYKAIFIDKDGTLIKDVPYNVDPRLITLEDGVLEGLRILSELNFLIVIISNQSGIARGFFQEQDLGPVRKKITALLEAEHVFLSGFYYCPHHPDGSVKKYSIDCICRKPEPGMIIAAADELNIDLSRSWMIGDILNDVEAGKRAGCRTILIDNGNETEWIVNAHRTPDFTASNVADAAEFILDYSDKISYQ